MNIGLTYDLKSDYLKAGYTEEQVAEFDQEETIDAIEGALRQLGHQTERIGHVKQLATQLVAGQRWDLVFNICEGLYGIGREAQVPALLDAYHIPYVFSDVLVLSLTLHKGMAKRVVRDLGIPTPNFSVVTTEKDIELVNLPYPLFAKPIAEGTGKGINSRSKILDPQELHTHCQLLLDTFKQPVLVETFLPGREFTVGIVGTGEEAQVIGVMEIILRDEAEKEVYSYVNKEHCEELVQYVVPEEEITKKCEEVSLKAWRGLNCRDGGRLDLRLDQHGIPNFLEVNPLAGLHPQHSDLPILSTQQGITYLELIRRIVNSAIKRIRG